MTGHHAKTILTRIAQTQTVIIRHWQRLRIFRAHASQLLSSLFQFMQILQSAIASKPNHFYSLVPNLQTRHIPKHARSRQSMEVCRRQAVLHFDARQRKAWGRGALRSPGISQCLNPQHPTQKKSTTPQRHPGACSLELKPDRIAQLLLQSL